MKHFEVSRSDSSFLLHYHDICLKSKVNVPVGTDADTAVEVARRKDKISIVAVDVLRARRDSTPVGIVVGDIDDAEVAIRPRVPRTGVNARVRRKFPI